MKLYLFSLGAGVLVGVAYHLIGVRSPAPPLVALVGLLGMLGGEQLVPVGKQYLSDSMPAAVAPAPEKADAASVISVPAAIRKPGRDEEARS